MRKALHFKTTQFLSFSLLLTCILVFAYVYWTNIERPGALTPQGWYGVWADQKRYFEQATAIANWTLGPSSFHYPILYPLLGALFLRITPWDPFLLPNAAFFLITIWLTFTLISKFFGQQKAYLCVLFLLCTPRFVYDFVTPWTTSLTASLFLAVIYIALTQQFSLTKMITIVAFTGLAGLTRYADVLFFLPVLFGFLFTSTSITWKKRAQYILMSAAIFTIFVGVFFSLNLLFSDSLIGHYIQRNRTVHGFSFAPLQIFEKAGGFFLNSYILHRQIAPFSSPFLSVFPLTLFLLSWGGAFLMLLRQEKKQRVIYFSILVSFLLWLVLHLIFNCCSAYTLKNLALHYIKPWYPVFLFFSLLLIERLFQQKAIEKNYRMMFLITSGILFLIPFIAEWKKPQKLQDATWIISAGEHSESAQKIIDHDKKSVWTSDGPRRAGDFFLIDLQSTYRINRLTLFDGTYYPVVNFDTKLSSDGDTWVNLGPNSTYNIRYDGYWEILGYIKSARYIKIVLNEETEEPWAVGEVEVYGY